MYLLKSTLSPGFVSLRDPEPRDRLPACSSGSPQLQLRPRQERHVVAAAPRLRRQQRVVEALHEHVAHEAQPGHRPPGEPTGEDTIARGPDVPRAVARPLESLVRPRVVELEHLDAGADLDRA